VVQVGDQLDRGDDELAIIELLEVLKLQAEKAGGGLHVLVGNHETMNAQGNFMYATDGAMEKYDRWNKVRFISTQAPRLRALDVKQAPYLLPHAFNPEPFFLYPRPKSKHKTLYASRLILHHVYQPTRARNPPLGQILCSCLRRQHQMCRVARFLPQPSTLHPKPITQNPRCAESRAFFHGSSPNLSTARFTPASWHVGKQTWPARLLSGVWHLSQGHATWPSGLYAST